MKRYFAKQVVFVCVVLAINFIAGGEVFLPGMQPEEGGIEFAKVGQCEMCHGGTDNGQADPFFSWQSGMMAQAGRDPVFRAALAIANQDVEGVGEFCNRCHFPRGWLEGRSSPADGSRFKKDDMHGISCEVCHQLIDPLGAEAAKLVKDVPPGYGNAMMVADTANVVRGPYGDGSGAMPHGTKKSEFHASSNLCGTCHDISHPLYAKDVKTQPPHSFGHIERTYSEWLLSDFAKRGRKGTCQSCHYEQVEGGGQASKYESKHRDYFVEHGPAGGSTWVQDAVIMLWKDDDGVNPAALQMGKQRSREMLKRAASLELSFAGQGKASLRITNLTGHKLPSGYPEGRRMWVNLRFLDESGGMIREIGKYGMKSDTVFGKGVNVPTLLDPDEAMVYEIVPGLSESQAKKYEKKPGKSFHFVLNDLIVKDNRIPPEGFNNAAFAEHLSEPVGAVYEDGQYWDDVEIDLPEGCAKVTARLMYQSVSWEYIKFLAEENKTDDWGKRLYEAWSQTGQCEPEVMAEISGKVAGN